MKWYLDTSAAMKLMAAERESEALAGTIDREAADLVGCLLLETEARRAVQRSEGLTQERVTELLDGVELHEVPPALFREAGLFPGAALRSFDALHLAAAIHLDVDAVLTYDERMASAARSLGLAVVAPR